MSPVRLSRRSAAPYTPPPVGLDWGLRSTATTVFDSGRSVAADWDLNAPDGVQNGDLVLLLVSQNNNPPADVTSIPEGFTHVRRIFDSPNMTTDIYWKAAYREPTTYVIGMGGPTKLIAFAAAYAGMDTLNPFVAEDGATESTTRPDHTTASITVGVTDAWLVSYAADRIATGSTATWSGVDEIRGQAFTGGSNPNSFVYQDTDGPVAPGTYSRTLTSTVGSGAATMWIGALRKGTGSGGGGGGDTLPDDYLIGAPTEALLERSPYIAPTGVFTLAYGGSFVTRNTTWDFRGAEFQPWFFYDTLFERGVYAGGSTDQQKNNRPYRLGNTASPTSNIAMIGGKIVGQQPTNLTWIDMKHGTLVQADTNDWIAAGSPSDVDPYRNVISNQDGDARCYLDGGWAVIDGLRVKNTHDGFGCHGWQGSDGVGQMIFRNCYFEQVRDDVIESDEFQSVDVYDSWVNGCYGFLSARPSDAPLLANPQSSSIMRVRKSIIRHEAYPGGHKRPSYEFNHSYTYKRNGNSPALIMEDCIIVVEKFITVDTGLNNLPYRRIANGDSVDDYYQNVTIVWAGTGPYAGNAPPGCTVTTDMSIYHDAVADWKSRHGFTSFDTVNMAKMIHPDPA